MHNGFYQFPAQCPQQRAIPIPIRISRLDNTKSANDTVLICARTEITAPIIGKQADFAMLLDGRVAEV